MCSQSRSAATAPSAAADVSFQLVIGQLHKAETAQLKLGYCGDHSGCSFSLRMVHVQQGDIACCCPEQRLFDLLSAICCPCVAQYGKTDHLVPQAPGHIDRHLVVICCSGAIVAGAHSG